MQAKVIRIADIATTPAKAGILPVSPATIWRWVRAGKFPKPFKIGAAVTAWKVTDVEDFIAKHSATVL
jgi:prophage regulatory protein